MKKLTLIKPVTDIQLGHLYEHVFCMALGKYLRKEGLLSYLDFYIDGKTYYAGWLYIEVSLYSDRAEKYEQAIKQYRSEITPNQLTSALSQIFAEKLATINYVDSEKLTKALKSLDAMEWTGEAPLRHNVPDTHDHAFDLKSRGERNFLQLKQTISLDAHFAKQAPETNLPLFYVVAKILLSNLQEMIMDSSGCFTYEDDYFYTGSVYKELNYYRIDKQRSAVLTNELTVTKSLAKSVTSPAIIKRIAEMLQHATYDEMYGAPDRDDILRRTGRMMSAADWREIGTAENIAAVCANITVSFSLGKDTQALRFTDL